MRREEQVRSWHFLSRVSLEDVHNPTLIHPVLCLNPGLLNSPVPAGVSIKPPWGTGQPNDIHTDTYSGGVVAQPLAAIGSFCTALAKENLSFSQLG